MKRTLRRMKNEVAFGYEALLRHIACENERFASYEQMLVLHIGEANASFYIEKIKILCYIEQK